MVSEAKLLVMLVVCQTCLDCLVAERYLCCSRGFYQLGHAVQALLRVPPEPLMPENCCAASARLRLEIAHET